MRARGAINYKMLATMVLLMLPVFYFSSCQQSYSPPLPDKVDFNYDIRPILVQKCYLCHGPDPGSRKGHLRLDTYEGATALSKEGTKAITPGHSDKSTMVYRINHKDPEIMMPAPESNLHLTEREIALIEKWIDQGAEWKQHWAFIPPEISGKIALQDVDKTGIDFFINQKLEQNGLEASPEADKNTLIRRVSYLLTGLPPTPEALNEFITDKRPNAYEKMIDDYLRSDHFGERWARHWMDIVRYAETKGHEFDYTISDAWRYRDYLIRAFNNDLPYDQFIKEHIAGDLLNKQRINLATGENESHVATVFYAMAEGTHSPVDIRQDEADRIDNIIDVTGKAFQGLTISCARCHDHKFDPITSKDYYSLFGIIEGTRFSPIPANIAHESIKIQALQLNRDSVREIIAVKWMGEFSKIRPKHFATTPKPENGKTAEITVLGDFRECGLEEWKSDGLAFGNKTTLGNPVFDKHNKIIALEDGKASSRKIETGIFGALRSPDFIIDKNFIGVRALGKDASIRIVIDNFQLISYPIYGAMDQHVNTDNWSNFKFDVSQWKGQKAYIEILPGYFETHVFKMPPGSYVEAKFAITYNDDWIDPPHRINGQAFNFKKALDNWVNFKSTSEEIKNFNTLLRGKTLPASIPELTSLLKQKDQLSSIKADSTAFFNGVYDGFAKESHVFIRGSYKELSEKPVERAFLSALKSGDTAFNVKGSGRLQLAQSIANPANPLTARVMVNRIWHHIFGKGIVETVDNFGMQGKLPSHPDLLDYLAIKFKKENFSIKKTIRSILMSDAFKRSVKPNDQARKTDPNNLWLSHYPVKRLEAEAIRDALLSVSGKLDTTMYGPPVPAYITSFMNGRGKPEKSGPIDGLGRRSIYIEVRRNFLDPMMTTFDRPIPFTAFGKRNVTNVPSQSLILLNDPFVAMQAETMAKKMISVKNLSFENRVQWIYTRTVSRTATVEEIVAAKEFIQRLGSIYKTKEETLNTDLNIWKDYIHSVFNLKEFIYLN